MREARKLLHRSGHYISDFTSDIKSKGVTHIEEHGEINSTENIILKEGDGIGRILMIEFGEQDSPAFDEVMDVLKRHPDFEYQQLNEDSVLSIPGLEIYPNRKKIYRGRKKINLTVKEYDLFYLLVVNQGHVLTYNQIYQKIWGEDALGNESNTIKCHIRNLREKLYAVLPDAAFTIRCEREVGYYCVWKFVKN